MNPRFIFKSLLLALAFFGTLNGGSSVGNAADALPAPRGAVTEADNGYYYTVQKGDTLWDLSQRFSATPWVWPELWEENSETIANPHLIYPGQKIRLTRRLASRPSTPVAKGVSEPSVAGIHYYFPLSDQYGFVRRVPVNPDGVILQPQESAKILISEGDIVYVRPEGNAALSQGQLLTIYRTFKPLIDSQEKELIGTQHLLCGVLEIVKREPQYAIAKVVDSYRQIMSGDQLMPYQHRPQHIEIRDSQPGMDGKIIKAEEHLNIMGEAHVAFINRGNRHGVKPGQIYSIYRTDEHDFGTVAAPRPVSIPVDFGELLVLHTEDDTSTVLIIDSQKESFEGTRVRTPLAMR